LSKDEDSYHHHNGCTNYISPTDVFHEMTHLATGLSDVSLYNRYGDDMNLHLYSSRSDWRKQFRELDPNNPAHRREASKLWQSFLANDCQNGDTVKTTEEQ
jgi:hypothetical protein